MMGIGILSPRMMFCSAFWDCDELIFEMWFVLENDQMFILIPSACCSFSSLPFQYLFCCSV